MIELLNRLKSVDPKARQAEIEELLRTEKRPREVNKLVKELKVLRNLNEVGISPYDAFTKSVLTVIPSTYRAPIALPGGSLYNPDINVLTRNIGLVNDVLGEARGKVDDATLESLKKDLYDQVEQLTAIDNPEEGKDEIRHNYFTTLAGANSPKGGFFQSRMIRKRQNLSGRGVIVPNSNLGIDEAEIPFDMGFRIYDPFVRRALNDRGYSREEIDKAISSQSDLAKKTLQAVGNERPVILNRAPSIWGGSVTGHRPIFVDKETIGVPNLFDLYAKGDHDGDTVAVHVPVTKGAINDVFNMAPSNTLIAEQSGKLVAEPEHSAIVGIYNLSKTPEGRKRINAILPDQYDFKGKVSKLDIIDMLQRIALDKGSDAAKVINDIRKLGDNTAYESGLSIGISDLSPLTAARTDIMPDMLREIRAIKNGSNSQEELGKVYAKYIDKGNKMLDEHFKNSNSELADIYLSKARGSQSQYRDMMFSPIAVSSRELPYRPIKHSYVEGLTPAEYSIASHGARIGVLGRSQGTAMPGALGKELLATANTLIVNKPKGQSMGEVNASLSKWRKDDIIDRYLSRDIVDGNGRIIASKDTLITPKIMQTIEAADISDIWVYTPLQSSSADGGIPAMAYGNNHKGSLPTVGENIGATSAFAIVEPLFTGSMSSFHSGGSLGGKAPAFPRIKQILELTKNIPDKGTLASLAGEVTNITGDSLGGHTVYVGNTEHFILPQHDLLVSAGDKVSKGDPLSKGTIDPRELAELKGLSSAQNYMVDELQSLIPKAKRRALETVVEGITRHAQITDPGDSSYLPGDIDLISSIEKQNSSLPNKIKYDFLFKGVNYLPQNTQSWLSKFNFRNIKREFTADVMSGAETDTSGYEPAPAMARGLEFGKGDAGRY